jgi:MoaA/NifB/PqqE/SkfB family radical SAM enzyme
MDNNEWKEEMIRASEKYNADWNYPGVLIHAYSTSHRSVGCSCGTSYFYITPYGDMTSCDFNHRSFGNVLEEPLYQVWEKLTSHAAYKEAKWGGCKVKDSVFLNDRMDSPTTSEISHCESHSNGTTDQHSFANNQ